MRRLLAPSILLVSLSLAACGPDADRPPEPTATGPTASVPEPVLQLPADAPTTVSDPAEIARIDAGDRSALLPPGAEETFRIEQVTPADPVDQIAVTWSRGPDPLAPEVGLVVWQRFGQSPTWRAVYAFTDRPTAGVLGVRLASADLTADGIDDLFTQEQRGGSGACATWRVVRSAVGSASEIFLHDGCDTEVSPIDGGLAIREAVFEPADPHCCPSAYRTTVLAWGGRTWQEISSGLEPAP